MLNSDPGASMESQAVSRTGRSRISWFSIATQGILGLIVLAGVSVVGVQIFESNDLRVLASKIQPGDERAKVDVLLGGSTYGYEYGWPSAGAPPAVMGDQYGGPLNSTRQDLDSFVACSLRGRPQWYNRFLSQHYMAWPVVVEYTCDGLVTAVYVDSVRLTAAENEQTH